jgi:hypothetical protein
MLTEPLPSNDWGYNRSLLVPLFRLSGVRGYTEGRKEDVISVLLFYLIFENEGRLKVKAMQLCGCDGDSYGTE